VDIDILEISYLVDGFNDSFSTIEIGWRPSMTRMLKPPTRIGTRTEVKLENQK